MVNLGVNRKNLVSAKEARKKRKEKDYNTWNTAMKDTISKLVDIGIDKKVATRIALLEDRVSVLESLSHEWHIYNKKRIRNYKEP